MIVETVRGIYNNIPLFFITMYHINIGGIKMPRTTREWAQRKLDNAEGNLNWAMQHLLEVCNEYSEAHPEIANPLQEYAAGLLIIQKAIVNMRMSI